MNITETGPLNWKDLQDINNSNSDYSQYDEDTQNLLKNIDYLTKSSYRQLKRDFTPEYEKPIGLELAQIGYGNSKYDKRATLEDLQDLNEFRANELSGLLLLANGTLKMVGTGVSTFLNSTIGLLYGIGTGVKNLIDEDDNTKFIQGLWDNDFNKAMSDFKDEMEEALPNYYSRKELENPWYTNILSANFIGDKFLKNMGFTIGALAAMYVTGGSGIAGLVGKGFQGASKLALGSGAKLLGASRGTLAGVNAISRGVGNLASYAVQGVVGAAGEASIEAIEGVKEAGKDIYNNLQLRQQQLIQLLDPNDPQYYNKYNAIIEAGNLYKSEVDAKLRDAGNSIFLTNMAILSVSNAIEFGTILKGGFSRSAKLMDYELKAGSKTVGEKEFVESLLRGEKVAVENTVDKSVGRTLGKTMLNAFSEGSEEAAQNLASNSRLLQAKAKLNKYATDSILGPRINPDVTLDLVEYSKAFSKAWYDNFGSPESKGWEEFFLGALTGGIGFIGVGPHDVVDEKGNPLHDPLTGKRKLSWKPRTIGDWFQGGYMEAKRSVNEEYERNQVIIDAINQKLSDADFVKRTQHAIADKSLSTLMQEALNENDIFKFKNSEIGKLIEDVFFFRDKGMIDQYKALYEGFTNIDDKTLQLIYAATTTEEGSTQLSQEDLEEVRQEYLGKAKRILEKIKVIQDYYDFVDLQYRDRSSLFKEELAYQYIRLDDTKRRIAELEEKNKKPSRIKSAILGAYDDMWIYPEGMLTEREKYEESFLGLTEQEQEDLKRLKRQAKLYQHRIDKAKKDPSFIDFLNHMAYIMAQSEFNSKDVDFLIKTIKEAKSVAEIDRILSFADKSVRQDIINRLYQEGDDELKDKLNAQIYASQSYTRSLLRLRKKYSEKFAKELDTAIQTLLQKVYVENDLDLEKVKEALEKIYDETKNDSIDTVNLITPENRMNFSILLLHNKDVLLDVLEGTIEDVKTGLLTSEIDKIRRKTEAKTKEQKLEALQKQEEEELKKQKKNKSFEDAINSTTYLKKQDSENLQNNKDLYEKFGILELESAIKEALEDVDELDNPNAIKNVLKVVHAIVTSANPGLRAQEIYNKNQGKSMSVDNILDWFINKYKKSSSEKKNGKTKDTEEEKKKKGGEEEQKTQEDPDAATWIIPNLVSYTVSEKDGVKTTNFTFWRVNKDEKLVPTMGGGLPIDTTVIDETSLDTEDIEKPVLMELKEADGKFAGTIRYSLKGQKGRILAEVKFKEDPVKKAMNAGADKKALQEQELTLDIEEEDEVLENPLIQSLINKFYQVNNIDPKELSLKELKEISDKIKEALDYVNNNKTIPIDLMPYADVILSLKQNQPLVFEGAESPSVVSSNDNELNGAYLGLYDVGNKEKGRSNKLQNMEAVLPDDKKSLEYFYENVENAGSVLWCIDNLLKTLKELNTPIKVIMNKNKQNILYLAVKSLPALLNKAKNKWLVTTQDGDYIIVGTLGFNLANSKQKAFWNSISLDILELIPSEYEQVYWVSTEDSHKFRINNIGDGRPAKIHYLHTLTSNIVDLIEGVDKSRNPENFTLQNLKWEIIYGDGPKSLHVKHGERIRGANIAAGKVYVLVPTPSGVYYRHPVNPITVDEINKDSSLYKEINQLIEDIINKQRVQDVLKLKNLLVLENDTRSFLDIYFNDSDIKIVYTSRKALGETKTKFVPKDSDDSIKDLKDILFSEIRPFISVTLAHLTSPAMIRKLSDAGALQLKGPLAMFSYVGANYTVIPYNESSNSKPSSRAKVSLETLETELRYNGQQIFKKGTDYYKDDKLVTDPKEIETLNDISAINDGIYKGESLWKWELKGKGKKAKWVLKPYEGQYFIIEKGTSVRTVIIYHKDDRGNITKLSSDEAKKIFNIKAENKKYAANKVKEEDEKSEEPVKETPGNTETRKFAVGDTIEVYTSEGLRQGENSVYEVINIVDTRYGLNYLLLNKKGTKVSIKADDVDALYGVKYRKVTSKESENLPLLNLDTVELRKQDAVKRATYDLEQAGFKKGDEIELKGRNDIGPEGTIIAITYDEILNTDGGEDSSYTYSDIGGGIVVTILNGTQTREYKLTPDYLIHNYKKVNKQSQKPVNSLDNSNNNATFVNRLLNSRENPIEIERIEDILYDTAATIAEENNLDFDDQCTIEELRDWYLKNVRKQGSEAAQGFDLNSIPSNADYDTIEELLKNCIVK